MQFRMPEKMQDVQRSLFFVVPVGDENPCQSNLFNFDQLYKKKHQYV